MKRSPLTITVAFVLIFVFGLLLFTYQVRKSEVAVVTFFGRIVRQKVEPGLGLRWPWPIERVYKLDQRIQTFEGKEKYESIKLPDQNIVLIEVYVGWKIENPMKFFPQFLDGSISVAEERLEGIVRNAKNEVVGKHVFSDFVSTDEKQMKFTEIEKEILDRVKQDVSSLGLDVKFVQIKKIGLPETVTQNVFDRMKSEREKVVTSIEASGTEAATKIKSRADADATNLLANADAQALDIQGQGIAQMIESLKVLEQKPDLARFNMEISALEQMLKEKTTLILDQSTAPINLLQPIPPRAFDSGNTPAGKNP